MSKAKDFINEVKTHWNEPDAAAGKYVPYKEYGSIFVGVAMNYGVQAPLKYISFAASCYLIMYIYKLPYLAFSVITLIGLPLSYLWNILGWVVNDNLGLLEKKVERKYLTLYGTVSVAAVLLMVFDISKIMPEALVTLLNSIPGISARSFFKIFAVQLFINAYGGLRNILWRKKLVPKYGRYKYVLFANYVQKSVVIILLGWLPIYNIKNVDERVWLAYLLFSLFNMFDFSNVIENCTQTISPNPQERLWVRTWPVKIAHLLENIFGFLIPLFGIGFDDINFWKFVLPGVFIPTGALTLWATRKITERIPQPPLEKKQKISFWYGVSQVIKNKYRWLDMFSSLIDSLGNGMLSMSNVMYFFSMRLYTQAALYGVLKIVYSFRSTPMSFLAPVFIRKFSYRALRIFRQICEIVKCVAQIGAIYFFGDKQTLCGIVIFTTEFIYGFIREIPSVAGSDMSIRLDDYQMYLSGERLENSKGVFNWFITPVTTLVGLIIPLIMLKNGLNSNWDVLFIDSQRFGILAVPLIFDLVGHILMMIPYIFWDYNNEQHNYVIEVLKQRERLANEGYIPATYEGGLEFEDAGELHAYIPSDASERIAALKANEEPEEAAAES